jgi:hypothetical protein
LLPPATPPRSLSPLIWFRVVATHRAAAHERFIAHVAGDALTPQRERVKCFAMSKKLCASASFARCFLRLFGR